MILIFCDLWCEPINVCLAIRNFSCKVVITCSCDVFVCCNVSLSFGLPLGGCNIEFVLLFFNFLLELRGVNCCFFVFLLLHKVINTWIRIKSAGEARSVFLFKSLSVIHIKAAGKIEVELPLVCVARWIFEISICPGAKSGPITVELGLFWQFQGRVFVVNDAAKFARKGFFTKTVGRLTRFSLLKPRVNVLSSLGVQ